MKAKQKKHLGSSLDSFLEEQGILRETTLLAIKRVLAWKIVKAMEKKGLSKTNMADLMKTSRAVVNRLLDPNNTSVTLNTLDKVASILGKRLKVDLIEDPKKKAA